MILYVSLATWPQGLRASMVCSGDSIAQSVCKEIEGHKVLSVADAGKALSGQWAHNIINMLKHCKTLSSQDASHIIQALNTDSPYEESAIRRIREIIDLKLQATSRTMKGGYMRQILKEPEAIFLSKELTHLQDSKASLSSKFALIIERLNLVGCCYPEEHTLKRCLALVFIMHYTDLPVVKEKA